MTGLEVILTGTTIAGTAVFGLRVRVLGKRVEQLVGAVAVARSDRRKANTQLRQVHVQNVRLGEERTRMQAENARLIDENDRLQEISDLGLQDLLKEPS